jgi:hypothetical protein
MAERSSPPFPVEDQRRGGVAPAEHVFGEVQACFGEELRAGHPVETLDHTLAHLPTDAAEGPDRAPEIGRTLE